MVTKFKWTPQARFLAERAKLTADDVRECEEYAEKHLFIIAGTHVHDWLNWKFRVKNKFAKKIKEVIDYLKI